MIFMTRHRRLLLLAAVCLVGICLLTWTKDRSVVESGQSLSEIRRIGSTAINSTEHSPKETHFVHTPIKHQTVTTKLAHSSAENVVGLPKPKESTKILSQSPTPTAVARAESSVSRKEKNNTSRKEKNNATRKEKPASKGPSASIKAKAVNKKAEAAKNKKSHDVAIDVDGTQLSWNSTEIFSKIFRYKRPRISRSVATSSALAVLSPRIKNLPPTFILDTGVLNDCFGDGSSPWTVCSDSRNVTLAMFRDSYNSFHGPADWNITKASDKSCMTLKKGRLRVDIRIIHRKEHYWFLPVTETASALALLPFNLTIVAIQGNRWLIPAVKNMTHFTETSLKYARFLNCNGTQNSSISTVITRDQFERLVVFRDFLHARGVAMFLFAGTLLGWYRECGIIPDTTDLDTCVMITQYSEQLESDLLSETERFTLHWILGTPSDSLELSVMSHGVKIDVFFLFEPPNEMAWAGGMIVEQRVKMRWTYPHLNDNLCSGDLLGHLFYVPCDVEAYLRSDYGPNWRTPRQDKNYDWKSSNFNVHRGRKWRAEEWPVAFRKFQ